MQGVGFSITPFQHGLKENINFQILVSNLFALLQKLRIFFYLTIVSMLENTMNKATILLMSQNLI